MSPVSFPQANSTYGPPGDMTENQVGSIKAFTGEVCGGSCDGMAVTIVAWKPDAKDLQILNAGGLVYLETFGGLPPHRLLTEIHVS